MASLPLPTGGQKSGSTVGSVDPGAPLAGGEGVSNREILEVHKGGQEGKKKGPEEDKWPGEEERGGGAKVMRSSKEG